MKTKLFWESVAAHAKRIGLPKDHTKMLRQVLTLKRKGYPPESISLQINADDDNWAVATSTLDELERELGVTWEDDLYIPEHLLVFTAPAPASENGEQAQDDKKLLLAQYGLYKGKQPPFGYLFDCEVRIQTAAGQIVRGHSLIPDPEALSIVDDIFAEFINRISLTKIVSGLNVCGVPSPEKPYWDEEQVRDIVHRAPLYAGFIVYHNGKHKPARSVRMLYPGRHAALIDLETALTALATNERKLEWTYSPAPETVDDAEEVA